MKPLRVGDHGEIRVPRKMLDALGLLPGSHVRLRLDGSRLVVERADFDPLADLGKKPDGNALESAIDAERRRARQAHRTFEKLIENPPEVRPEDHPDFWD